MFNIDMNMMTVRYPELNLLSELKYHLSHYSMTLKINKGWNDFVQFLKISNEKQEANWLNQTFIISNFRH